LVQAVTRFSAQQKLAQMIYHTDRSPYNKRKTSMGKTLLTLLIQAEVDYDTPEEYEKGRDGLIEVLTKLGFSVGIEDETDLETVDDVVPSLL
jgi:hypothetical protein